MSHDPNRQPNRRGGTGVGGIALIVVGIIVIIAILWWIFAAGTDEVVATEPDVNVESEVEGGVEGGVEGVVEDDVD